MVRQEIYFKFHGQPSRHVADIVESPLGNLLVFPDSISSLSEFCELVGNRHNARIEIDGKQYNLGDFDRDVLDNRLPVISSEGYSKLIGEVPVLLPYSLPLEERSYVKDG